MQFQKQKNKDFIFISSRVPIQQIFYYLASVPWKFTFVSMVMQVSNSVQPHNEYLKNKTERR